MGKPSAFDDPKVYVYARKRVLEGVSLRELAAEVGVSKTSALRFRKRIRAELAGKPVTKKRPTYRTYTSQERLEVVQAVLSGQMTKAEAVDHFGLTSVKTLNPWIQRYNEGGPDALLDKHECPHVNQPATERALREELAAVKAENAYLKALAARKWNHL